MRIRRLAQLVGTTVLIITLSAGGCWSQIVTQKNKVLAQLTQATKDQLSARASAVVKSNPKESAQLALDLVIYRWLVRSSNMPMDVVNITTIIPALSRKLGDPTIDWARQVFSTLQASSEIVSLPPSNDDRVALLSELQREYVKAANYKESYPAEAVILLRALVDICQKLHLDISQALVLKELGDHYLYDMAKYRDAANCYNNAIWIFAPYNCTRSSAIVYDDYGSLNVETGCYAAAKDYYILAAQQWVLLASQDSSGYRYRDLAGREYMRAGDALRASGDTDKALQLMTAYGLDHLRTWAHAANSYSVLIPNLIIVAELYKECGNIPRALSLLQEANRASLTADDSLLVARTYEVLADVYTAAHQDANSAEARRKREQVLSSTASMGMAAIDKLERNPFADEKTRAALYVKAQKGAIAYDKLSNFQKSAQAWQKIADVYSKAAMTDQSIAALRALASVLDQQDKPQKSSEVRLEAAMAAMKANKRSLAADIVRYDLVPAFIDMGDLQNALEAFNELVPIIEGSGGNLRSEAQVLEARGMLLAKYGQYDEAIRDFQNAEKKYHDQVGDLWSACNVALKLAAVQMSAGHADESCATLKAFLGEIESNSASEKIDPTINSKQSQIVMNLYHDLVVVNVLLDRKADADAAIQNAKRYSWLPDLIRRMKSNTNPKVARFAGALDIVSGSGRTDDQGTVSGERLLADNWFAYWQACLMIGKQNTLAYNALPVDPLDLYRMRDSLPKLGAVIEYMTTDTGVYVFVCKYGKSICRQLRATRQDVGKEISDLRIALKNCEESQNAGIPVPPMSDWQGQAFMEIRGPLARLYDLLIAPIKQDIETAQSLHFALCTEMEGLPMHALIKPGGSDVPKFLIREYAVSYLAKGMLDSFIHDADERIDSNKDRLAIFADPRNNLPGAREEAKAIKALYLNSQWYIGENATVANFIKECGKVSVVHVAAHYKIDPNPANFELNLASKDESDDSITIEDLSAISNSHLSLIVLSACDSITSSDPISSGPSCAAEVFSMVGAKSVLGGLWKVSDKAASNVMGDFYRAFAKGKSKIEALRAAQLASIDQAQFAHPFYWACFALYGGS